MKKFFYLLFLPLALFGADAANDLILTQVNSSNTGNTQRNVAPLSNAAVTDAATFRTALGTAFNQVIAKSANFTVTAAQNGAVFNVTTGASTVTATMPTGASGLFFLLRKADSGAGGLLTSPSTTGMFIAGHSTLIFWDTNTSAWLTRDWFGSENTSGALTISSGGTAQNITLTPTGFVSVVGSGVRLDGTAKSLAAWGVAGPGYSTLARTYTDSTSSGTVATAVANSFAIPTFAASSATTFSTVGNLYIAGDVAAGTNVTLPNSYGLWNAGKSWLQNGAYFGATTPGSLTGSSGALTLAASGTNQNINATPSGYGNFVVSQSPANYNTGTNQMVNFNSTGAGDAGGTTDVRAITGSVIITGSNASASATGMTLDARNSSSSTASAAQGFSASVRATSTGAITAGYGARVIPILSGAGNMSNWYGFNARGPTATSTGVIADARGIYIEAQKVSGVTTGYGIYQEGTSDLNFFGGKITTYNNIATAGNGIASVQGAARVTAQTGANASVTTYTVGASDASFLVSANVNVTASTTHSFTTTCVYTDEGNVSRTLTFGFTQLSGATFITAITNVTGTGPYESPQYHIRAKAATTITIATTGTFTSVTYNAEGAILKVL